MMNMVSASALLAEDEGALRNELREALGKLWPDLRIVAEAADGITASQLLNEVRPDIAFLDVRMPGLSGLDVARLAAHRCHVIFLTAYNDYAVDAFEHGAVDYLLKPLSMGRLAIAVQRAQEKLAHKPANLSAIAAKKTAGQLRWIQASNGGQLRFINVSDVRSFVADAKYTKVSTPQFEAHIRTTIKDLAAQLDAEKFWQISRSIIVSVAAIDAVRRIDGGLMLRLRDETEWLAVSQPFQYQFKQM